jgi:hypothetical protein
LRLYLSELSFQPSTGNLKVDGKVIQYNGISFVVLRGELDVTVDKESEQGARSLLIELPFEIFADEEQPAFNSSVGVFRKDLSTTVLSDKNLKRIKSWLKECTEGHSRCTALPQGMDERNVNLIPSEESIFLPTRLLYVGDPKIGKDPRIVFSKDEFKNGLLDTKARYLALSYCWGSFEESLGHLKSDITTHHSQNFSRCYYFGKRT